MIKALSVIEKLKTGNVQVLKSEKWLKFLALASEMNINLERINSLEEMKNNYVLSYVEKTLKALSDIQLNEYQTYIIEETLKWSEVAKSGLALFDFSFEEFIKAFLLITQEVNLSKVKHISFEWLMKDIYYQHEGKKRVNIYKKTDN